MRFDLTWNYGYSNKSSKVDRNLDRSEVVARDLDSISQHHKLLFV